MSATARRSGPIRVLIAKPGLDGHDVGAKVLCRALMEAGMDVIYTGLRQTAEDIVAVAREEDVDVIGLSILSGAHLPLCRQLQGELERQAMLGAVTLMVGGHIPRRDFGALEELGVEGIFPSGSDFEDIVSFIRREVER